MKKRAKTITIGRNSYGYYYNDDDTNINGSRMIDVFGMLIARLAGTIQHDEDVKNEVKYQIEITKTITKETTNVKSKI